MNDDTHTDAEMQTIIDNLHERRKARMNNENMTTTKPDGCFAEQCDACSADHCMFPNCLCDTCCTKKSKPKAEGISEHDDHN